MYKTGIRTALLLATLVFLCAGCAITAEKEIKTMGSKMSALDTRQKRQMDQASPVQKHDRSYLGQYRMKLVQDRNLPGFFDEKIVLVEPPMTLPQAASKISQLSGVSIELSPRLQADSQKKKDAGSLMNTGGEKESVKMPLRYEGSLKGLLDNLAAYHGAFWEWRDGTVFVFRLKTVTYDLITGAGETSIVTQISNKNETGSGNSGKDSGDSKASGFQLAEHSYALNLWDKVVVNIETMLSDAGRVVATQSTGTVTVTDTPSIHKEVQDYLNQVNDRLSRQVAISVKIYTYTINDTDSWGYSLKAAFEDLENEFAVSAEALTSNITDPSSLFSAAILEKSRDDNDYDATVQQWEGSEAIIKALNKRGNVRLVTSGSGIVMNNQPLPIQNTSRTGYLAKSEISQGETSTTSSLEAGSVTTGFALSATPHILENNEVVLRYNITLSELLDIKTIESGDSKIQTPEISSRNFMQQARMKMGETLFLAGFQKQVDEYSENKAAKGILGWQKDGSKAQEMVVVSITINEVDA